MIPIDEKIKEDFDKVIRCSQPVLEWKDLHIQYYFKTWAEQKMLFYKAFGNKLIYEFPEKVSFELSEKTKKDEFTEFLSTLGIKQLYELKSFVTNQGMKSFFNNTVIADYDKNIKKGMKLVKAFKFFIEDKEQLENIQNYASRIIQENKIEGRLCFSIHPLDYLSISENNHKWRSCHALDGEYRAGNLSYMLDNCTFICYLKSDEDTILPHFPESVPWNNKKWRVLLYMNEAQNLVFAGRQYPFSTTQGLDWILKNGISQLFKIENSSEKDYYWLGWQEAISTAKICNVETELNTYYMPFAHSLVGVDTMVEDADGSRQFNDLLRSSCYIPQYACLIGKHRLWIEEEPLYNVYHNKVIIGGKTLCLCCGKEEILEEADSMLCYDCDHKYGIETNEYFGFCDGCGARIDLRDEAVYIEDGDTLLCHNCAKTEVGCCDVCGDTCLEDDMIIDYDGKVYCSYCWENRDEEER